MAGHIARLQRERPPPHTTMYWMPEERGEAKNTWRSTFKEDLEEMGVRWHGARRIASDWDR